MSTTSPTTKPVINKKVKKRTSSGSKENRASGRGAKAEEEQASPALAGPEGTKAIATLNDPAIIAAGRPRRQPLSKKTSATNMDGTAASPEAGKTDGTKARGNRSVKVTGERSSPETSPKATRGGRKRRGGGNHGSSKSAATKSNTEGDESVSSTATKSTPRKERSSHTHTAPTPPRFRTAKSKQEQAANKTNESIDSEESQPDDKTRSVRFQTESPVAAQSVSAKACKR